MKLNIISTVLNLGCIIVLVVLIKPSNALLIEPVLFLSSLIISINECIRCYLKYPCELFIHNSG